MAVGSYDPVASNNSTINGVALGENVMAPSDVNNAIRELMADLAILKGTEVANTPAGDIVATEVQAAINELDTDKIAATRILTAGVGIVGGGDLSADRTFDLSLATLPAGTVATADEIAMADVDDSNNVKKITAQSIADLAAAFAGGVITTSLTIDNGTPYINLDEDDGTAGFSITRLMQSADVFSIGTRTSADAAVATDYEITKDASGALQHTWRIGSDAQMRIDSSGRIITGAVGADPLPAQAGGVLISTGNSGVTNAENSADDLIIESAGNAGISILSPNTALSSIVFGDPEDNNAGRVQYDHPTNEMRFFTAGALRMTLSATDFIVNGKTFTDNLQDAMTLNIGTADDVQSGTSNFTWTKPGGATADSLCLIICTGGGGGGGSGAEDANPGADGGGGGGAGGNTVVCLARAGALGATEAATVGAGGTGGPPGPGNANGIIGSPGARSRLADVCTAPGGLPGNGGASNIAQGGFNAFNLTEHWGPDPAVAQQLSFSYGANGGQGNDDASEVTEGKKGAFAGGGGGGCGNNTQGPGQDGGGVFSDGLSSLSGDGGNGGAQGANGSNGSAVGFRGRGGGGAGTGNFHGGAGSVNGGGGGGGGCVNGTNNNVDGGDGGDGLIAVYTWF